MTSHTCWPVLQNALFARGLIRILGFLLLLIIIITYFLQVVDVQKVALVVPEDGLPGQQEGAMQHPEAPRPVPVTAVAPLCLIRARVLVLTAVL